MSADMRDQQDLTVKGESVERLYGNYRDTRYVVNRRYQRKLVWTLEEKRKFIDSIANGYPVPIILLAEDRRGGRNDLEIIDGMQRLNAIMSFIENEYAVGGEYFDLNTMAASKALLDTGELVQQEPLMDRNACVRIAAYTVPLSVYEYAGDEEVDEVFRRINSGGRKLSRQELRAAGATGHFASAVREIASRIRGDVSSTDELLLNEMKRISITQRDLPYGLPVDEVFWVHNGILTKEQVRESRDEEVIADMLAFILLDPPPSSRSEFLDDYFGLGEGDPAAQRFDAIELAVQKHSVEVVASDFQRVLDSLKLALSSSGRTFGQLLFGAQPARAPRYFQIVFLALYKLIVSQNQEVASLPQLIDLLAESGAQINVPEGGRWGGRERANAVNAAAGVYAPAFAPSQQYDPARVRWITKLENILTQSYTEQAAYDFKQGLLRLDGQHQIDEASLQKVFKTLVGIANLQRGTRGYVLVGIADKAADARRVEELFGVQPRVFERFYITGVEHEAQALSRDLDQFFQTVTGRVRTSEISEPLRDYVARNIKLVRYYDKTVLVLESQAQADPSRFGDEYYVRHGNELRQLTLDELGALFRRFYAGS